MKKISLGLLLFFFFSSPVLAQSQKPEFLKAKVTRIIEEGKKTINNEKNHFQKVELSLSEGSEKGKTINVEHGGNFIITEDQKVHIGDTVVLSKTIINNKVDYRITDNYRLHTLLFFLLGFALLIIFMAGKHGVGSIIGMGISIAVIFFFIVPQIMQGSNPLLISILGSLFIMVTTIYLAHGISQQTTIAIISTFISLLITILLSMIFVKVMNLSGVGSEDMYALLQGFQNINFQGLLLGSMIIGTLGVLDDVTTTQTATMYTLAEANPNYSIAELFKKGMRIGREHITSLVNTLVLAYAGASIGVFIYLNIGVQRGTEPLWVMLNSEFIIEEIVRTLSGSLGLILAVPITTLLATFFSKYSLKIH